MVVLFHKCPPGLKEKKEITQTKFLDTCSTNSKARENCYPAKASAWREKWLVASKASVLKKTRNTAPNRKSGVTRVFAKSTHTHYPIQSLYMIVQKSIPRL